MSGHQMTPHGSQLRVLRGTETRKSEPHAPKPSSPPSLKHDPHDIEETDLFSIMSSKESTAAHSSVFSRQRTHQQPSTSRSTTPDAPNQELPEHTVDDLLAGIGVSYEERRLHDLTRPGIATNSPCHTPVPRNMSDDGELPENSGDSDSDHDLEADADRALSEWYGIHLREIPRPFRIVHLFEEVKDKCTEILEAEGFGAFLDDDRTPTPGEDEQPPQDGSSDFAPTGNPSFNATFGQSSAAPKRKCGDRDNDEEDVEDPTDFPEKGPPKTRGRYKKRRNPQEFSCPYRKRNPLRFNISRFESCANKSYESITLLKRHCRDVHFLPPQKRHCSRCRLSFDRAEVDAAIDDGHVFLPITQTRQADPEDGFGREVSLRLGSRERAYVIHSWEALWGLLFGSQDPVPSPDFEPVHEHHAVAHDLSSQCHTWADQFIPIISRWAKLPEWDAWVLNSDLRQAFGTVLSPVLKDSKALSLEGMTRRRPHPMLLRDTDRDQFDPMSLHGISPDLRFEMDSSTETPQDLPDFSASTELPLDLGAGGAGGVFEDQGRQQEALMPDAPSAPVTSQPWTGLGGNGEFYQGTSIWPNGESVALGQGALTYSFNMPMRYDAGGYAGPSNIGKGVQGRNRGRR